MILRKNLTARKAQFYDMHKTTVNLVLTSECNNSCQGCYLRNFTGTMPESVADKAVELAEYLRPGNAVIYIGGEPTLQLNLLERCQKNAQSRELFTEMYTNGWWGRDDDILQKVSNLNLDILLLSVDDIHKNDREAIKQILEEFITHDKTELCVVSLEGHEEYAKDICDGFIQPTKIYFMDENGIDTYHSKEDDCGTCFFEGVLVFPDGTVHLDCPLGYDACKIHDNIEEDDAFEKIKSVIDSLKEWTPKIDGYHFVEYCMKNKGIEAHNLEYIQKLQEKFPSQISLEDNLRRHYPK